MCATSPRERAAVLKFFYVDFETFNLLDLREVGLDRYAKDPSCGVSMLGYAAGDGELRVWLPHLKHNVPDELIEALADPNVIIISWNAQFERAIFKHVLKLDIPISRFRDPIVLAHNISLPGKLAVVAKILKMKEQKDERGEELVQMFCN